MPIRASERAKYPPDWPAISLAVKERAKWRCVGSPKYPRCRARHGKAHPVTGSKVVLTTAHLDHDPTNCSPENLRAWCQRCHLTYDAAYHAANAARTRRARVAADGRQRDLFGADVVPFSS